MQELSDEDLVARSRAEAGSPSDIWVNELFRRYHGKVAVWCLRFTGDRELAGDLAQDVFLKAYRNLHSFRGDAKFSTWLYSVARNHCFNENKARAARSEESLDSSSSEVPESAEESVLATLQKGEELSFMRTLLQKTLDETERKVMVLHFAQDFTLDAITRLLDLNNPSGAKAYVVSAKRKLSATLKRLRASEQGPVR
jgi:RNA polymerase sigma-70 factor (ECF subfamily)